MLTIAEDLTKIKIERVDKINDLIHFIEVKVIVESVEEPLVYYYKNLVSIILMTSVCIDKDVIEKNYLVLQKIIKNLTCKLT